MEHELTHFLAFEIFKNEYNPYGKGDVKNKERFEEIANKLKKNKNKLDNILKYAFSQLYEEAKQVHAELIVRVPEMLARYANAYPNGMTILKQQAPELLTYYEEVFLHAVNKHIDKLECRAMSNWPKELFLQGHKSSPRI